MLTQLGILFAATVVAFLVGAGFLHLLRRLGRVGDVLARWLCRAPGADLVVFYFTLVPPISGTIWLGWAGLGVAILGQAAGFMIWATAHELAHPVRDAGPRISRTLSRLVGPTRNHLALWWTALAVPVFWLVRFAQVFVYPPQIWLLRMPRYRHGDWINVSRQKFTGLVGYDLVWCLYCDWMTGVWSLGSEMLRNIESFWCPIRFLDAKKCENCVLDFPDVDGGWVREGGTMQDVASVLEEKYGGDVNAWFGHPVRLTVKGEERE